ncbi:P-loop containing nucleoside triphosphate hydrolase protein [Hypoxylon trugodes]|uniref:P-loop containing nucleoside triphosphate hydrolase protein n=1 Tax=Hypoxylon trugodes TaxID=326681 RepID=UPI0021980FE8|nr:P-loop containing nucleoside triphosphate hydrolase protein [Hypoxylon trugodes]KAI1387940.1 P-loop containing nucleoside triphosphate hydrolase protein [Hypoxylon trugodes]
MPIRRSEVVKKDSVLKLIDGSEKAIQQLETPMIFQDYTDGELMRLLIYMFKKRDVEVQGGFDDNSLRVLIRRIMSSTPSEALMATNARAIKDEFDKVCRRQALWLRGPGDSEHNQRLLTREDIAGPTPKDELDENASWKAIKAMIGLEKVKSEVIQLFDFAQMKRECELQGKKPTKVNLNRLFLGPPGAGKTTVAKLYGQIIADLGLVSKKDIMVRNGGDLIGQYIGHTEQRTRGILRDSQGKVLIIDDAHMLYQGTGHGTDDSDVFRQAAVDTLVANTSADPGEDRCIILVGYEDKMREFFNNTNPGLQRRFPMESAICIKPYSEDRLCDILDLKMAENEIKMTESARKVSREVLRRMRINPKFGNGGDVENLLSRAKTRYVARTKQSSSFNLSGSQMVLDPADFDPDYDRASNADKSRKTLFEGFVGFEEIVDRFKRYQGLAVGMRRHDIDPRPHIPWAFIFKGPPGTGKTSTARKIGRLYYDMGLLSTDEVVICSVTDLIGECMGQTGPKVISNLELGLGKVLFIDEAYRLIGTGSKGGYHSEAVGELVDAMTKPRYAGNMVVILAGYTEEMEYLLRMNQGLRSRFATHVAFPHMDPHSCLVHLRNEVQKLNIDIVNEEVPGQDNDEQVHQLFAKLSHTKGWVNGRDVETLAKTIVGDVYSREGRLEPDSIVGALTISMSQLIEVLENMLQERMSTYDCGEADI